MRRPLSAGAASSRRLSSRAWRTGALIAAAAAVVLAANSLYVVGQDREAVVLRLGRPVAVINPVGRPDPGLWVKWPFVDRAVLFDRRSQTVDADQAEIATHDQNRLTVGAFLRYRVVDPLALYQRFGGPAASADALRERLTAALRDLLGAASAHDIVVDRREALTGDVRAALARQAQASGWGVQVIDVRLRQIDLAPATTAAIERRLEAAMEQRASDTRARADQQKREAMADADRQAAVIRATAEGQAAQIRGQGEAQRMGILNAAYGQDPEFAQYLRSMQAYRETMARSDAVLVLSPQSPFLHALAAGPGDAKPAPAK